MERLPLYLALGTLLFGIAAATSSCYDCWYWTLTSADDNCNSEKEFHKVENQTCEGKCYTTKYTLHGSVFVGRGCEEECEDGETGVDQVPGIKAMRKCCDGNHCNNAVVKTSGAAAIIPASTAAFTTLAAIMFLKLQ